MTVESRPWLPPSALGDADVDAAVTKVIEGWYEDWLGEGAPDAKLTRIPEGKTQSLGLKGGRSAGIAQTDRSKLNFGLALCAGAADLSNPRDRTVLIQLAEAASNDLLARLDPDSSQPRFGPSKDAKAKISARYTVSFRAGDFPLTLDLGEAAITAARLQTARHVQLPPLGTFPEALADEWLELGLHLGFAELTAAEIGSLARGDVIALDRLFEPGAPLIVGYQIMINSNVLVEAIDRELVLTLENPPISAKVEQQFE